MILRGHLAIAEALIKQHEGLSLTPYKCPAGRLTIGYGRNLEDKGLSVSECEHLLANDIYECEADLRRFPYWARLNDRQKAGLLNLRYNVGGAGYRSFKRMNAALEAENFEQAAAEVIQSKYAEQVGRRAQDIADLLQMDDY